MTEVDPFPPGSLAESNNERREMTAFSEATVKREAKRTIQPARGGGSERWRDREMEEAKV